jgi:hypothetical protein
MNMCGTLKSLESLSVLVESVSSVSSPSDRWVEFILNVVRLKSDKISSIPNSVDRS